MVQYIKKRKFKNDNRFKYVYYKIDGKTKKRVSSKEYYKNKKNKKYIGGNKYKGVSILKTEDNSPINGSIKQITRVDKNLIEFLSKHQLDNLFKRDKDIIIHGVPYVSYKMSPNTLKKMEEKMEELQKDDKYDGPHIFRNRVTYSERNIHKDMYIWDIEGEENPDIDETQEEFDILSKKSIDGKGFNPLTNKRYSDKYLLKDKDGKMRMEYYLDLPLYIDRDHVRAVIENNQITLILSGTGSGKSVIVPKIALQIINYGYGYTSDIQQQENRQKLNKNHKVIMTLPKRIITSTAAKSSANELDVIVGEEVGFKHRNSGNSFDKEKTILLYATDGTLEAQLRKYPTLQDESGNLYDIVIIDEVHERNQRIDMIIHMMKFALKHNPSLKLILMSATVDAKPFKDFFSGFKFQDIAISGQPMKTIYPKWINIPEKEKNNYEKYVINEIKTILENEIGELDDEDITNPEYERMKYVKGLYDKISDDDRKNILNVQKHVEIQEMSENDRLLMQKKKDAEEKEYDDMNPEEQKEYDAEKEKENESQELDKKGSILFFDSNTNKAKSICESIQKFKDNLFLNTKIYCTGLSSNLIRKDDKLKEYATHDTAYKNSEGGPYGRKVIIATNVAESSLTIKGLSYVIDSGYEFGTKYDPNKMMQVMETKRISKAQAQQRWGRVGRTQPGMAIRLYTEDEYNNFEEYPDPELLTTNCMPLLLEITNMVEKKNKYSEILKMKYHNAYNIKSIEELMVKTTDFFVTPIKQDYFDNAKNILEKLKCLDKDGNFTLDFYLIREIFEIINEMKNETISFSIFDAKMILESFICNCVDDVIDIIVCCKYLKFGSLTELFNSESDKKNINKKNLYKKYKKFIDQESDHITILNLYKSYKQNEENLKKKDIETKAFYQADKTLNKFTLIKSVMSIFKKQCEGANKKFPKELEQINSIDYRVKFPNFVEKNKNYLDIVKNTLKEFSDYENNKKILENNNLIIESDVINDMSIIQIQKILSKILDEKYLPIKDRIILKLRRIFNQELESDNNKVFKKINLVMEYLKKFEKNDNSIKTKILYSLYQTEDNTDNSNHKVSTELGRVVNPEQELQPINSKKIEAKKEILLDNDPNKNIKRCIVAGYSVHICQYQKEMPEEQKEQEGGGWWPFSFGKGKEDNPNENYVNCFPKDPTTFTTMFEENQNNTFVNFKNRKKKYIIYNTLTSKPNYKNPDKPTYMANVITIIPEKIINEFTNIIPTNNGQCSVQSRMR